MIRFLLDEPYRWLSWMRRISPVYWVNLIRFRAWIVTGFPEAEAMLKDHRFVRDGTQFMPPEQIATIPPDLEPLFRTARLMLMFQDGAAHTRLRRQVTRAFTPKLMAALRPEIEHVADELLDACVGRTSIDIVADFAYPLTVHTIVTLIGCPASDIPKFKLWSAQFVRLIDIDTSPKVWRDVAADATEFRTYLLDQIARKRVAPGQDLLTTLVHGGDGHQDRLTDDEIVATCMLTIIAGHETSTSLISTGFYWLLRHPEQYALLAADPALLSQTVEETLRFDSPGLFATRFVGDDLTFAGKRMTRGQLVLVSLAGANRDPRVVDRPDTFDITRTPGRDLSFGAGAHYCIGASLGRLEGQVGIERLMTRLAGPALTGRAVRRRSVAVRGFDSVPVRATVRARDRA